MFSTCSSSPSFLNQCRLNLGRFYSVKLYIILVWVFFLCMILKISKLRNITHIPKTRCVSLEHNYMCSSVKYIFVYAKNTAYFLLYDCFFKATKVYWCFLLMNPLFHHVSSEIFLPWVLASSEGGADVSIQVLQWKKETRVQELNTFNPSTELPSKMILELKKKKKRLFSWNHLWMGCSFCSAMLQLYPAECRKS